MFAIFFKRFVAFSLSYAYMALVSMSVLSFELNTLIRKKLLQIASLPFSHVIKSTVS